MPVPRDVVRFLNLSGQWYGLVSERVSGVNLNRLELVDSMNDYVNIPNAYGCNPFGDSEPLTPTFKLRFYSDDANYEEYSSFNGFLREKSNEINGELKINQVVENLFYKSPDFSESNSDVLKLIVKSQYLVCLTTGFFGLVPIFDRGAFVRFDMHDIGKHIPNVIDASLYEFTHCSFVTIGEIGTLFIAFKSLEDGKFRYVYMNDKSFDQTYGFPEIRKLLTDGMMLDVQDVFDKVDSTRQLGDIPIVLTDWGFWDMEQNSTNDLTYSYGGDKEYTRLPDHEWVSDKRKDLIDKVVLPEQDKGNPFVHHDDAIFVEYDKKWLKSEGDSNKFQCKMASQESQEWLPVKYPSQIHSEVRQESGYVLKPHDFVGGDWKFALYDGYLGSGAPIGSVTDSAYILVNFNNQIAKDNQWYDLFKRLLLSNSDLSAKFVKWLYDKSVVSDEPPTYGERYLMNRHPEFAKRVNELGESFKCDDLSYGIGWSGEPDEVEKTISNKFSSVRDLVVSENADAKTLYDYCDTLNAIVNKSYGLPEWMFPSEQSQHLRETIKKWFLENKWRDNGGTIGLSTQFVDKMVDELVSTEGFDLLGRFKSYLSKHLGFDLSSDGGSGCENMEIELDDESLTEFAKVVLEHMRSRVRTALVLGGYKED